MKITRTEYIDVDIDTHEFLSVLKEKLANSAPRLFSFDWFYINGATKIIGYEEDGSWVELQNTTSEEIKIAEAFLTIESVLS